MKKMFRLSELVVLSGYTHLTMLRWVKSGKLKAIRRGGLWMVEPEEVERVFGIKL